jgi:hypothetical protein
LRRGVAALALVALGAVLSALYALRPAPLVVNQDAIVPGVERGRVTAILRPAAGGYLDVQPEAGETHTLFIFYPGGRVRPQAYQWLGVALAPLGVRTVIPVLPLDLAVLAPNRADALLAALEPLPERVVIGGHSLGGAMAARYARANAARLDGLVMMAAYSAASDDLSDTPLEVLVLAAERDGLAALPEIERGLMRLPPSSELHVVRGAVHSFFGRYGPQRGDGIPTVARAEAEADILLALRNYFAAR